MNIKRYSIDLSEQMAVCDANYIRILKLLRGMPLATKKEIMLPCVGKSLNDRAYILVVIEVIESFKYTSTVRISQNHHKLQNKMQGSLSKSSRGSTNVWQKAQYEAPEMMIRMYHDASTAEVISYQGHKNFKASYPIPNKNMYHADEKEQLNLFLSQWLQLCQAEGLHPEEKLAEEYLTCLESE